MSVAPVDGYETPDAWQIIFSDLECLTESGGP
jgi:hypothetical protein